MEIEILGSGVHYHTCPRMQVQVCVEAREKGIPYSRTGPSIFLHGPDVLIDTPEEIKEQINRSRIQRSKPHFTPIGTGSCCRLKSMGDNEL